MIYHVFSIFYDYDTTENRWEDTYQDDGVVIVALDKLDIGTAEIIALAKVKQPDDDLKGRYIAEYQGNFTVDKLPIDGVGIHLTLNDRETDLKLCEVKP